MMITLCYECNFLRVNVFLIDFKGIIVNRLNAVKISDEHDKHYKPVTGIVVTIYGKKGYKTN